MVLGFDSRLEVALSAGVQQMVRSDLGASGVMFTLDTESGFDQVVFITSSYGLGETVVQGSVNPDEFYVYKPNLAAKRPAILRKSVGGKSIRMVFGESQSAGRSTVWKSMSTATAESASSAVSPNDVNSGVFAAKDFTSERSSP